MRVWMRYRDVFKTNWHVGFTAFGGPAVQFQTVGRQRNLLDFAKLMALVPRKIRRKAAMDRRATGSFDLVIKAEQR